MPHDVEKLPTWARLMITDLEREVSHLRKQVNLQAESHKLLKKRKWIKVEGPSKREKVLKLFCLDKNAATPMVYLYHGDLMLIGRQDRD